MEHSRELDQAGHRDVHQQPLRLAPLENDGIDEHVAGRALAAATSRRKLRGKP